MVRIHLCTCGLCVKHQLRCCWSTQDFGSWNIGSSPMAAASHSSNRKGQGTSNPQMWVQLLHETSGYVAKRLCTGLLTRDTQVRLLSYPSFFIPTITVGFFCFDQIFHVSITRFPAFLLLPFQQQFISFSSRKSSQINKQHENDPFSFSFTCKKFGIDEGGMTVHPSRHP